MTRWRDRTRASTQRRWLGASVRPSLCLALRLVLGAALVAALVSCGAEDGEASGGGTSGLGYCDVAPVLEQYCLRCHGEPQENFAPFALTSFAALQQDYSGRAIWERMGPAISSKSMPFTGIALDPPVAPLPAEEESLLLEWLGAGAPRGEGSCGG